MNRAEVWWADLPAPVGRRPVLIVTRSAAVASRNQVVVAQITRTVHGVACEVPLTPSDGMPQACVVNCDVLLTVPKTRFANHITTLSAAKMNEVAEAIRYALAI